MKSWRQLLVLFLGVLFLVSSAEAATKRVACPVVVNKKTKTYQTLSSKDYVCYKNTRRARAAGYAAATSSGAVTLPFAYQDSFAMDGIGETNSPAFRVTNSPAFIQYEYTGTGVFYITARRQPDGAVVENIVELRGKGSGTAYFTRPGVYYLEISGQNKPCCDTAAKVFWSIDFQVLP